MIRLTVKLKNGEERSEIFGDCEIFILGMIAKLYKADTENKIEKISVNSIDTLRV